ncbi:MAG: type II toxin-antitoxin system death-on-curing family toxin [Gammaproteobacteria bacterium]|nr:MAG: type II toxin-antitoxin system death-on-curing family toxin [Gammaproteobacteria bacterium]
MSFDREPIWIGVDLAQAIHDRQLAEHGGPGGVRDEGALASALARPQQRLAYGQDVDIPTLAAAYAAGIARNHPFVDGNKRTAYVVCRTFLILNGWDMIGPLADRYPIFLGLAEGAISEDELTEWLRGHCRPERVSEGTPAYSKT